MQSASVVYALLANTRGALLFASGENPSGHVDESCWPKGLAKIRDVCCRGSLRDGFHWHVMCFGVPDEASPFTFEKCCDQLPTFGVIDRSYVSMALREVANTQFSHIQVIQSQGSATHPATLASWWDVEQDFVAWHQLPWKQREFLLTTYREHIADSSDQLRFGYWGYQSLKMLATLRYYPAVSHMLTVVRLLAVELVRSHQQGLALRHPFAPVVAQNLFRRSWRHLQLALSRENDRPDEIKPHEAFGITNHTYWGAANFRLSFWLRKQLQHIRMLMGLAKTTPLMAKGAGDAPPHPLVEHFDVDALGLLRRAHRVAIANQQFVVGLLALGAMTQAWHRQPPGCNLAIDFDRDTGCCDHTDVLISLLRRLHRRFGGRLLHVVEIGVSAGLNAGRLMKALPGILNYTGVDPNELCHTDGPWLGRDTLGDPGMPIVENEATCGNVPRRVFSEEVNRGGVAQFLEKPSLEAAKMFGDESIDFVFIDGLHDENVAFDLQAWIPKVRHGGIVSGHDFCDESPSVIEHVLNWHCALSKSASHKQLHLAMGATYWWAV